MTDSQDPIAAPGAYDGERGPFIPPDIYHASDRTSRSQLVTLLRKSPAHYRAMLASGREATAAMKRGTYVHAALLEPERFSQEYALPPQEWNRSTVDGRESYYRWLIESCGWRDAGTRKLKQKASDGATERMLEPERVDDSKEPMLYSDAELVRRVVEQVNGNRLLTRILQGPKGWTEATYAWDEAGVRLRARLDRVSDTPSGYVGIDLKLTRDASPEGFKRAIVNQGLHVQAAMYARGFERTVGEPMDSFVFIAIESEPMAPGQPHAIGAYLCDDAMMQAGRDEYAHALDLLIACREADRWPDYSQQITTVSLPNWYLGGIYRDDPYDPDMEVGF